MPGQAFADPLLVGGIKHDAAGTNLGVISDFNLAPSTSNQAGPGGASKAFHSRGVQQADVGRAIALPKGGPASVRQARPDPTEAARRPERPAAGHERHLFGRQAFEP